MDVLKEDGVRCQARTSGRDPEVGLLDWLAVVIMPSLFEEQKNETMTCAMRLRTSSLLSFWSNESVHISSVVAHICSKCRLKNTVGK